MLTQLIRFSRKLHLFATIIIIRATNYCEVTLQLSILLYPIFLINSCENIIEF